MSNDEAGWRARKVKHADGRTGAIQREREGEPEKWALLGDHNATETVNG